MSNRWCQDVTMDTIRGSDILIRQRTITIVFYVSIVQKGEQRTQNVVRMVLYV